jgi:Radical SAM superfamily/4Fe-4S single cluster domain
MPNILLTSLCNRSCPYCFAETEMSAATASRFMTWENLIYIADFLEASDHRSVSVLGGEPTIHRYFVDFVLYLLERNFTVTVFTNGMVSAARLAQFKTYFADVSAERLHFVCNLNDPVQTPASEKETRRVHDFLSAMGPWTSPGFNIYRTDFSLDFLFDYINRFGLKRSLRLGLTQPIPGKQNAFIRPSEIRAVVQRLYSFRDRFDLLRVKPGLDCGFPICQFTDEELGWLHRSGSDALFGCGPAFDISPDMSVYYCFPLSNYRRKSLFDFDSVEQVDAHFRSTRDPIKAESPGIFAECDGCRYQEDGLCAGGGLCQAVHRFIDEAPIRLPEIEHELSKIRMSS